METVDLNIAKALDNNSPASTWRDLVGIIASIGCAIHCAAMPFVISYLPALGLSFLADESFHKWMALACFLIAIFAFIPGLRKHGNWFPVSIGTGGLFLITFAAFGFAGECCPSCAEATSGNGGDPLAAVGFSADVDCEHCEECSALEIANDEAVIAGGEVKHQVSGLAVWAPWLTPIGGLLLVSAHLMNRRYGCLCGCC
ncbi:MAG: MerC domain-containing protein [Mariniblastus sp.]